MLTGGPLMLKRGNQWIQVGVTSHGKKDSQISKTSSVVLIYWLCCDRFHSNFPYPGSPRAGTDIREQYYADLLDQGKTLNFSNYSMLNWPTIAPYLIEKFRGTVVCVWPC